MKKSCNSGFCSSLINLEKSKSHPCFDVESSKTKARIHLPVAPKCNIQCNYCNRKYDCINESRPGITSAILTPEEAFNKFVEVKKLLPNLSVVGFAGPGDALANFDNVKQTILKIKTVSPDILFCLSTNGSQLPEYADELVELGITHLTVTINTVNPELIPLIYQKSNSDLNEEETAKKFINNQLQGLKQLSSQGIVCKVNILCLKGINDNHIEEVVKTVKKHGAFMTNITKLIPAKGSVFESLEPIEDTELNKIRKQSSLHLKQMYHCKQCRADSVGLLDQDLVKEVYNKTS